MRVDQLGEGTPEVAVVAAIHGDEPSGVRALERLRREAPAVERPVKLVVANEAALEREARYVDEDLNRAFPGDPAGPTHERRLAHDLAAEVGDCATLALHSTQSYGEPFALVDEVGPFEREVCANLSVRTVVETAPFTEGRIFAAAPRTVEVESGFQGSESAADNAERLTREFLAATGALPAEEAGQPPSPLPVYRLTRPVPKAAAEAYEVYAANFERVATGEVYASVSGTDRVAEEPFYPVLMSPYGYEDVFGYAADRVGTIEP